MTNLKQSVKELVKFIPVTGSDVLSWNSLSDLNQSHEKGEVAAIPRSIDGNEATLIFSKRTNRLAVGDERIKDYVGTSEEEVLKELCDDLLYDAEQDENKALELCKSSEWWEV